MGLSLIVGIYSGPDQNEEGIAYYRDQFARINRALHHAKLPEHHEPLEPGNGAPWWCEVGDYSSLHVLRRLAAYLCLREELPEPGDEDSAADPINEQWCMWATAKQPHGLMPQLLGDRVEEPVAYEHLMVHSDSAGVYLPQPFHRVIIADQGLDIVGGGIVGSSMSLRDDCEKIACALDLPLDLDPHSDEMAEALENHGSYREGWQRYGIESYTCLMLYRAALASDASGCALVFA